VKMSLCVLDWHLYVFSCRYEFAYLIPWFVWSKSSFLHARVCSIPLAVQQDTEDLRVHTLGYGL
jgi:hypothetical protein